MKTFDLSDTVDNHFNMATTDSGLCQVFNGNTMKETYKSTTRVVDLSSAFEPNGISSRHEMIKGAGKVYQKVFWLDLGDKYVETIPK